MRLSLRIIIGILALMFFLVQGFASDNVDRAEAVSQPGFFPELSNNQENPGAQDNPPNVKVLEADANRNISRTVYQSAFSLSFTIQGENNPGELTIGTGPLTRADGLLDPLAEIRTDEPASTVLGESNLHIVTLQGNLPYIGHYRSWFSITFGGQTEIFTIDLTRQSVPDLIIPETVDNKLMFEVVEGPFTHAITVRLPDGLSAVEELELSLGTLSRQDGRLINDTTLGCEPCEQIVSLNREAPLTTLLTGDNFRVATYLTTLRLSYLETTQLIPIIITRVGAIENLKLQQPTTVNVMRGIFGSGMASVPIDVSVIDGMEASIYPPTLNSIELTSQNGNVRGYDTLTRHLQIREKAGTLVDIAGSSIQFPILIEANENVSFVYQLQEIEESGTYQGQIIVSGPQSREIMTSFVLNVKDHWFWALLLIALGVGGAYILNDWIGFGRERAMRQALISREKETVQKMNDASTDLFWKHLISELNKLGQDNRLRLVTGDNLFQRLQGGNIVDRLQNLRERKNIYIQAQDDYGEITIIIDAYAQAIELDNDKAQLDTTFRKLQTDLTNSDTDLTSVLESLQVATLEIKRKIVRSTAESLITQLQDFISDIGEPSDSAKAILDFVHTNISLQANANTFDFYNLLDLLKDKQTAYLRLRIKQLESLLTQLRNKVAFNNSQGNWDSFENHLSQGDHYLREAQTALDVKDVEKAVQIIGKSQQAYLAALIQRARNIISQITDQDTKDRLTRLINQAYEDWQNEDFLKAEQTYQMAQDLYVGKIKQLLVERLRELKRTITVIPTFLEDNEEEWNKRTSNYLQERLEQLEEIRSNLESYEEPMTADRIETYRDAAVKAELALFQSLKEVIGSFKEQWPAGIENYFENMTQNIAKARESYPIAIDETEKHINEAWKVYVYFRNYQESNVLEGTTKVARDSSQRDGFAKLDLFQTLIATFQRPKSIDPNHNIISLRLTKIGRTARESSEQIERIRRGDALYVLAILAITTVSGFAALWLNSTTFGSGQDYITAFLWGFGGHSAIKGFVSQAQKINVQLPQVTEN